MKQLANLVGKIDCQFQVIIASIASAYSTQYMQNFTYKYLICSFVLLFTIQKCEMDTQLPSGITEKNNAKLHQHFMQVVMSQATGWIAQFKKSF